MRCTTLFGGYEGKVSRGGRAVGTWVNVFFVLKNVYFMRCTKLDYLTMIYTVVKKLASAIETIEFSRTPVLVSKRNGNIIIVICGATACCIRRIIVSYFLNRILSAASCGLVGGGGACIVSIDKLK